ncbi:MAG TPA: BLUF domain-containing protein [Myxococcota bacterium]|nr:BLUF domain-containing protein [Myxococcota bacterium]
MKRVRYVSRFRENMSPAAIQALAREASEFNSGHQITGALLATGQIFFQMIEGPRQEIDALWSKIKADPRHVDVVILSSEEGGLSRLCPDWSMKTIDLSIDASEATLPLRTLIQLIFDQHKIIDSAVEALEKATWNMLLKAELNDMERIAGM